jgi:hypothetical protein
MPALRRGNLANPGGDRGDVGPVAAEYGGTVAWAQESCGTLTARRFE